MLNVVEMIDIGLKALLKLIPHRTTHINLSQRLSLRTSSIMKYELADSTIFRFIVAVDKTTVMAMTTATVRRLPGDIIEGGLFLH